MDTFYGDGEVKEVLDNLGISIASETSTDFLCYCPFHSNTHSPAFTISKISGLYICHNASCSESRGGNLNKIVMLMTGRSPVEAIRFIGTHKLAVSKSLLERVQDIEKEEEPLRAISQESIDELVTNFWSSEVAIDYMAGRGFDGDTLEFFSVGYDPRMGMITVPIHDKDGVPIGVNGRSIVGKTFKLTKSLPRNKILFNLHRAKVHGGTAIVCESQFDVMRIHQAGFPNAICFLGSHISSEHVRLIQRYFDRVIIMTDSDSAGRESGRNLSKMLRGRRVEWAIYDWGVVYPHGAKDAGDMTIEDIRHCIKNSVSDIAYKTYRPLAGISPV